MKFAVIGLGYFGSALVRELVEDGQEVIAIDSHASNLRGIQDLSDLAAEADGTDIEALRQLGVGEVDTAIVAIGEDFEASLMITAHCQKLGVKEIYTRVINEVHDHILGLMQVAGKIRAEKLAATYFTRQLTNEAVMRYFGLDSQHGIVELELPEKFDGATIADTELRKKYSLNIVTIRRPNPKEYSFDKEDEGFSVLGTPGPETKLKTGDRLVVFGKLKDIDRFCAS
ncbi:MAG: TrkA family potassium uptake protein [Verrucomicrobiae bacterium]|nr:TrkA family potassium uptake protein [Verrucomicrobiae bacterium]